MVLTRRAAREAEAAAAREAESSPIPTPDAEKFDEEEIPHIVSRNTFTTDQQNEPATIEDVLDVDVGAEGPVIADNHSKEEVLEDEDEDEDEDENDVDAPLVADTKIIDQGMRRAGLQPTDHSGPAVNHNAPNYKNKRPSRRVNLYLQLGHALALAAVIISTHAANKGSEKALPYHALGLLLCVLPLRMIVTTKSQSPSTKIGVSLAASAPFVFASNAIHILASRSDSESILVYLIASATQVAAAWLDMTAAFIRNSTLRRFIIPRAMLDTAADVYLAAIVAKRNDISRWTMIYFRLRIAVDICRIITSFATILSRDRSEKVGSATDRCQGDER